MATALLPTISGGTREVTYYTTETVGLIAHRSLYDRPKRSAWSVTHALSGMRVSSYDLPTRKAAKDFAKALGNLRIDWTADGASIRKQAMSGVGKQIIDLNKKYAFGVTA